MRLDEIKDRLERAAYVMRLLPPVKVQGYVTSRFEIVYTPQEITFMERKKLHLQPTQEQITQMDEAIGWLEVLEPVERKLVWKRAERIPWKLLCQDRGMHRSKLTEKYNVALGKIQGFLLGQKNRGHFQKKRV